MSSTTRNPFEKGFLDFLKLFTIKSFVGSRGGFSKEPLAAGGLRIIVNCQLLIINGELKNGN